MKSERIRGHLDALLLSVLNAGPAHGYEVLSELRARSDGEFDLPEGTVYPALHRLERAGLLASTWEKHAGRRRRVYTVTTAGREALGRRRSAWAGFVEAVDRVLSGAPAPGGAR